MLNFYLADSRHFILIQNKITFIAYIYIFFIRSDIYNIMKLTLITGGIKTKFWGRE